jgi:CheY-like chemotaxis protein
MLTDDLIFFSRVSGAARAAGLAVRMVRTPGDLVAAARAEPPRGVILDLHNPGLDLPALLTELKDACPAMPRVVAYGSHVEAATLRAARAAGCDLVLARSKFVKELEEKDGEWHR